MAVCVQAIGRSIKALRKAARMTQEDAADYIGISVLHYGRLERGERNVSLRQLERIAALFCVSPYDLLEGAFPDGLQHLTGEETTFSKKMIHLEKSLNGEDQELLLDIGRLMAERK